MGLSLQESRFMRPTGQPNVDPNAELRGFEPLRVVLALGGLLLGLVMSLH
jgi:hypothetical protein